MEREIPMQFDKPLYTVPETLKIIRMGHSKFYQELAAGRIKAVKAGHRTLVPAQSILDWIAALPEKAGRV